jgi:CxxC-x17-CxxC domain-containing protein
VYASKKDEVEEKILRWHDTDEEEAANSKKDGKATGDSAGASFKDDARKFSAICSGCGKETKTVFEPDGIRPVYCPECLEKAREKKKTEANQPRPTNFVPVVPRPTVSPVPKASPIVPPKIEDTRKFSAICSGCGKETKTVFEPDGIRPVYCKECLEKNREAKKNELESRRRAKQEELSRMKQKWSPAESGQTIVKEVSTAQPLSLKDLSQSRPVDFRGREIKVDPRLKKIDDIDNEEEKEIKEGDTVQF